MTSNDFLDTHTTIEDNNNNGFPIVLLKMVDNEKKTCPFVTQKGCSIYKNRPSACRIYPLGRASTIGISGIIEKYMVIREDHCKGFKEKKEWEIDEWLSDQGLKIYHELNDLWLEIIYQKDILRKQLNDFRKKQMFFMASYNLDAFRKFIYKSNFLKLFDLSEERCNKCKKDDMDLLKLSFDWLKFTMLGKSTLKLNDNIANAK